MKIKYRTSVKVDAGWRDISVLAECEKKSEKMATVTKILLLDGETPAYGQSRTGARRQEFNGRFVAKLEVGKNKRLSACEVIL